MAAHDDDGRPRSYTSRATACVIICVYVCLSPPCSIRIVRAVVILYYITYVRLLINWTTRQRSRRLDRKTPDVSIGRSCFIGIRTETRKLARVYWITFPFSLFFFFLDQPNQIMVNYLCTRTFTIIICFCSVSE